MNVFIIGGTGYIGRAVSRQLLSDGHSVVTLARSDEAAARVPAGTKTVRGDLTSLALIDSCSRKVTPRGLHGAAGNDGHSRRRQDRDCDGPRRPARHGAFVTPVALAVYLFAARRR